MEIQICTSNLMGSHMYIVVEAGHGLLLDPVAGESTAYMLKEQGLRLDFIILTHEHCDHCAGAADLQQFFKCPILASKACAKSLMDARMNYSHFFNALCSVQTKLNTPGDLSLIHIYRATGSSLEGV